MCPATLSPVYYMYPVYVYPATLAPGARRVPTSAGQAIARAAFVLQVRFLDALASLDFTLVSQ